MCSEAKTSRTPIAQQVLEDLTKVVTKHLSVITTLEERLAAISTSCVPPDQLQAANKVEQEYPLYFSAMRVEVQNIEDATARLSGILRRLEI